jgi:hypothetical protein
VTPFETILAAFIIATLALVTIEDSVLCAQLGGVYTPENNQYGKDVCPGGKWSNLLRPTPTK